MAFHLTWKCLCLHWLQQDRLFSFPSVFHPAAQHKIALSVHQNSRQCKMYKGVSKSWWENTAAVPCSSSSGTALVLHISRHAAVSLSSVCRHNQHAKSKYPKLFYLLYLYVFKAFDIHIYFFNPLIINQETCEQLCLWSRTSERKMLSIALVLYKAQQPLGTRHGLCHVCAALFPCSGRWESHGKAASPQRWCWRCVMHNGMTWSESRCRILSLIPYIL